MSWRLRSKRNVFFITHAAATSGGVSPTKHRRLNGRKTMCGRMFRRLLICLALLDPVHASEQPTLEPEIETARSDCNYGRAIELPRRYIQQKERETISDDILFAATVRKQANLGILLVAGKADRARLWKAIAIDHEAFGRDHPVVAYDYTAIGDILASEGQAREAESYYIQALKILNRVFGPEHPRTLSTFDKLARIAGPLKIWAPSSGQPPAPNYLMGQR
jgi:hypothetical protein